MAAEGEGNALCAALNANCEAIAQSQKATNNRKLVDLCNALHGMKLDPADAKASVRPFALATRVEVGAKVCSALVLFVLFRALACVCTYLPTYICLHVCMSGCLAVTYSNIGRYCLHCTSYTFVIQVWRAMSDDEKLQAIVDHSGEMAATSCTEEVSSEQLEHVQELLPPSPLPEMSVEPMWTPRGMADCI